MNKVLLIILDGFGLNPEESENPTFSARTPHLDFLIKNYPKATLSASAESVGLTFGEVGNSEIGHSNLGTGQLHWQNLETINQSIRNGSFFKNKTLLAAIKHTKKHSSNLHLLGLCSDGGIHSHLDHLYALMDLSKQKGLRSVFIHVITDGRDTKPKIAFKHMRAVEKNLEIFEVAKISTISGRYFAMDRDDNWDRTEQVYQTIVGEKKEPVYPEVSVAINESYEKGMNDENIKPATIVKGGISSDQFVRENDAVVFFNFRADRARQLTKAFTDDNFRPFKRDKIKNLFFATMTPYETDWKTKVSIVFKPAVIQKPISEIIAEAGLTQLHTAETEKFAHVTYFFNGGRERPESGEQRKVVPSPKVESYEVKPDMSLYPVVNNLLHKMSKDEINFVVVNFANPDMVGHTGNFRAGIKAIEATDKALGHLLTYASSKGYQAIVTSDHGNLEQMISPLSGEIDKEHTVNPVPFFYVRRFDSKKVRIPTEEDHKNIWAGFFPAGKELGVLSDVTPTVLSLLGLEQPEIYAGENLIPSLEQ